MIADIDRQRDDEAGAETDAEFAPAPEVKAAAAGALEVARGEAALAHARAADCCTALTCSPAR
jgi:hypothetical protein